MRWLVIAGLIGGCRFGFESSGRDASVDGSSFPDDGRRRDGHEEEGHDGPGACAGYVTLPGEASRYQVLPADREWAEAEAACESDGAHLVVLDGPNEKNQLVALVPAQSVWLGVTDRKVLGQWLKVTGGVATYLPWGASEPDAVSLECVLLDGLTVGLADQSCTTDRRAVCECDGTLANPATY